MPRKPKPKTDRDWRTLPRKSEEYRNRRLSMRVTDSEYEAINALANEMGLTIADLVVMRTLRQKKRV
jgi:uncharacterized protein (DUF1778 family)